MLNEPLNQRRTTVMVFAVFLAIARLFGTGQFDESSRGNWGKLVSGL
jgi:hypothetical protein